MQLTIGQLLGLVRHRLGGVSGNLVHNTAIRKLRQLEQSLGGMRDWVVEIPVEEKQGRVEPSQDFGTSSPALSVSEEEKESAPVVRKRRKPRTQSNKKEVK